MFRCPSRLRRRTFPCQGRWQFRPEQQ